MIVAMIGRHSTRRRPEPAPVAIPIHDITTAHAWGLTLPIGLGLTDQERDNKRDWVVNAPNF